MVSLVELDADRRRAPKILTIDIETRPLITKAWTAFDATALEIIDPGGMICAAAKWFHGERVQFSADWDGDGWLEKIWGWLNRADIVVTYNGDRFDIPEINRQFLVNGIQPPSPYKSVDLLKITRRFRFPTRRLEHVATELFDGHKLDTGGKKLWEDVAAGIPAARQKMKRYNVQDVKLTEQVYLELLPWIKNHPNLTLFSGQDGCPHCGSQDLVANGTVTALTMTYPLYRCHGCRANVRGSESVAGRPLLRGGL